MAPSSSFGPVEVPAASGPGPRRHQLRLLDRALLVACPVAVGLLLLLWTGVIPGNYVSSPTKWTTEIPTCVSSGERLPVAVHVFPLWATVHVRWTASAPVYYLAFGPYDDWIIDQLGTSGNATFVSQAFPLEFSPSPVPPYLPGPCQLVNVTTIWTYTI